jgi:hypothetical protein
MVNRFWLNLRVRIALADHDQYSNVNKIVKLTILLDSSRRGLIKERASHHIVKIFQVENQAAERENPPRQFSLQSATHLGPERREQNREMARLSCLAGEKWGVGMDGG